MDLNKIYPRSNDNQTVYLKSVVTRPTIKDGGKNPQGNTRNQGW